MKITIRSFAVCLALFSALLKTSGHAQTLYWDANGTSAGAGTTPTGTWGTDNFWNSAADGTGSTGAWSNGGQAVFSAGSDATGTYTITVNGTQTISGLTVEEGTPTITGGSLSFSNVTNFNITGNATIASALTGVGGRLDKAGTGTLILTGVNSYTGDSGVNLGTIVNFGILEVNGGSISHSSANMSVGLQSGNNGILNVTHGGTVSSASSIIGQDAGSVGTLTVDGSASAWTTNSNSVAVGFRGTGTLNITNGGLVTTGSGAMQVGGADYSSPSTGTLNITSGGTLASFDGLIGDSFGSASTGTVTVDGVGSTWTMIFDLEVGLGTPSSGAVTITNGGTVSSQFLGIGVNGATGAVRVDGAGSSLNVGDNSPNIEVFIGGGTGTLTLSNGGTLNVDGGEGDGSGAILLTGTNAGASGLVNIGAAAANTAAAGGIVNAASITNGSGTGTIQFKTTATSGSPYYFTRNGTASGAAVTVAGLTNVTNTAGYNVLSGANTYAGGTTVNGGTLAADGGFGAYSSLGSGIVTVNHGGRLTGDDFITGLTTVASGGFLAPGVGDLLNFNGGLTLAAGSRVNFILGAGYAVQLAIDSSFSANNVTLNLANAGNFTAGTYTLFSWTSPTGPAVSAFTLGTVIPGYSYRLDVRGKTLKLIAKAKHRHDRDDEDDDDHDDNHDNDHDEDNDHDKGDHDKDDHDRQGRHD